MIFCPTLYLGTKVQFHFTIKNVNNKSVNYEHSNEETYANCYLTS